MSILVDAIGTLLLCAGAFFTVVGCVGLVRMPDLFTRMHAASVTDTLGAGLLIAGMMVTAGPTLVAAKLAMLALLIFFGSPTATHALARAALARGAAAAPTPTETPPSKR